MCVEKWLRPLRLHRVVCVKTLLGWRLPCVGAGAQPSGPLHRTLGGECTHSEAAGLRLPEPTCCSESVPDPV